MPINYKKYPINWKTEIRPAILKRAKNCCEGCGLENYSIQHSFKVNGETFWKFLEIGEWVFKDFPKAIKVILTIAHLDHDINNNDYSNLKALCQLCHNRYDVNFRKQNRAAKKQKDGFT
jgi:hypothetical protein